MSWDIFHTDRLEIERGLELSEVRAALHRGKLREDDLIRPAGSSETWRRIADRTDLIPADQQQKTLVAEIDEDDEPADPLTDPNPPPAKRSADQPGKALRTPGMAPAGTPPPQPQPRTPASAPPAQPQSGEKRSAERPRAQPAPAARKPAPKPATPDAIEEGRLDVNLRPLANKVVLAMEEDDDEYDPEAEDEEAAGFTLARSAAETVEELDLAAMVDVAFQMVLFFMVTAATVIYKTLEVPKPNPESTPDAAVQGASRSMDDLQKDFILVDIDPAGAIQVDHEAAPNTMQALAAILRRLRQDTGRTSMLMKADASTPHRYTVVAIDAANEIGLKIAIANPTNSPLPPPVPPAQPAQ